MVKELTTTLQLLKGNVIYEKSIENLSEAELNIYQEEIENFWTWNLNHQQDIRVSSNISRN